LRWQNILKTPLNKSPWTKKEDEILGDLVSKQGENHWREIALELHSRSESAQFRQSKQCHERWVNHLDPSLRRGAWLKKEDAILLKEYLKSGRKWSEIAKMLNGRTENSVKNRWVSLLKTCKAAMALKYTIRRRSDELGDDNDKLINDEIAKVLAKLKEKDLSVTSSEGKNTQHNKYKNWKV
jgi:hypothetical protein